jgi:uncharacterized phage-associated protein
MSVEFQFDFERTLAAVTYLASKEGVTELTKYKICKLLFLADRHHLVRYGRVITGDKYCALPHGPVPSRTLNLLSAVISGSTWEQEAVAMSHVLELDRQYANPRFSAAKVADPDQLSVSDISALDKVITDYGRMGFGELKRITHDDPAYVQAWEARTSGSNGADMSFEAFFDEEDSDTVVGAFEAMIEDDLLRNSSPAR